MLNVILITFMIVCGLIIVTGIYRTGYLSLWGLEIGSKNSLDITKDYQVIKGSLDEIQKENKMLEERYKALLNNYINLNEVPSNFGADRKEIIRSMYTITANKESVGYKNSLIALIESYCKLGNIHLVETDPVTLKHAQVILMSLNYYSNGMSDGKNAAHTIEELKRYQKEKDDPKPNGIIGKNTIKFFCEDVLGTK
jgi:hypothetical protein